MKYFAVFLSMKDEEKSQIHRPAHLDFLAQMKSENNVYMYGRFVDGAGGLIIYKGKSLEQVEILVKKDPYIIHGARSYAIHEWDLVTKVDN